MKNIELLILTLGLSGLIISEHDVELVVTFYEEINKSGDKLTLSEVDKISKNIKDKYPVDDIHNHCILCKRKF